MILLANCLKIPTKYCPEGWRQLAQLLGLVLFQQVAFRLALSCQQVRLSAQVQEVHRLSQAVHRLGQAVHRLGQAVHRLSQAVHRLSQAVRQLVLEALCLSQDRPLWPLGVLVRPNYLLWGSRLLRRKKFKNAFQSYSVTSCFPFRIW